MLGPAGGEDVGQVPVAGLVDVLEPVTRLPDRGRTLAVGELPPGLGWARRIAFAVAVVAADGGQNVAGQFGDLGVEVVEASQDGGVLG